AVVPAVRRVFGALDDPAARAELRGGRPPRGPRALPRLADAALPRADAALVRAAGLRGESLRSGGGSGLAAMPALDALRLPRDFWVSDTGFGPDGQLPRAAMRVCPTGV